MTIMKKREQPPRIKLNKGVPKTPLPITPKGIGNIYIHFEQGLLKNKINNLHYIMSTYKRQRKLMGN